MGLNFEKRKLKLLSHPQDKKLTKLEEVFGQNERQIFNLIHPDQSIAESMDYENAVTEISEISDTLNSIIIAK